MNQSNETLACMTKRDIWMMTAMRQLIKQVALNLLKKFSMILSEYLYTGLTKIKTDSAKCGS